MMEPPSSTSGTSPSLLAQIRAATSAQHQRAESLISLPRSMASHIQTLKIFYGFIEPWECKVSRMLAPIKQQLQGRCKVPLLMQDLKDSGILENAIASLPRCDRLPEFNDVPTALGSMYVFEGATLGGQLISRHVEQELGLRDGTGYSFYRSYGSNVGVMWRQFGQLITENTPANDFDAVIRSAVGTFDCLCDFFEDQGHAVAVAPGGD